MILKKISIILMSLSIGGGIGKGLLNNFYQNSNFANHWQKHLNELNDDEIFEKLRTKFLNIGHRFLAWKDLIENYESEDQTDFDKIQSQYKILNYILRNNLDSVIGKINNLKLELHLREKLYWLTNDFLKNQLWIINNINLHKLIDSSKYQEIVDLIVQEGHFIETNIKDLNDYWTEFLPQEIFRLIKHNFKKEQVTLNPQVLNQENKVWTGGEKVTKDKLGIEEPNINEMYLIDVNYQIVTFSSHHGIATVKATLKYHDFTDDFFIVVNGFEVHHKDYLDKMHELLAEFKLTYSTIHNDEYLFNFFVGQIVNVNQLGIKEQVNRIDQHLIDLGIDFKYKIVKNNVAQGNLLIEVFLTKNQQSVSKTINVINFQSGKKIIDQLNNQLQTWTKDHPFDLNFEITNHNKHQDATKIFIESFKNYFIQDNKLFSLLTNLTFQSDNDLSSQIDFKSLINGTFHHTGTFWLNKFPLLKTTIYYKNLDIKNPIFYKKVDKKLEILTKTSLAREQHQVTETVAFDNFLNTNAQTNWDNIVHQYQTVTLFLGELQIEKINSVTEKEVNGNFKIFSSTMPIKLNVKDIKINQEMTIKKFSLDWLKKVTFINVKETHHFEIKLFFEIDSNNQLNLKIKYLLTKSSETSMYFKYTYSWKFHAVKWE